MKNVALLGVSAIFVAMGLFIGVAGGDPRLGFGTAGFFGVCGVVFALQIADARREQAWRTVDGVIAFAGPVTLRESTARVWLPIALITVAGVSSTVFGYGRSVLVVVLGLGLVAVLPVFAVLRALGRVGRDELTIDALGIRFARPHRAFQVRWDDITGVHTAEWNGHILVLLTLHDVTRVAATITPPDPAKAAKLRAEMSRSTGYLHAPLAIWAHRLGIDGEPLARALARYAQQPEARAELVLRPALPGVEAR